MSRSVNKVILLGFVGKDPEIRFTSGGTITASLSLATASPYKDTQGHWQERTEWHHLAAFSKQAEFARDYVKKGSKLYVEGRLQTRSWESDGQTHYRTEVVVNQFVFASEKNGSATQAAPPPRRTVTEELEETEITDEDVPW